MERADAKDGESFYYGINVSRGREPVDQLDALLLLSKLRRAGLESGLTVFVAGRYSELNGRSACESAGGEARKARTMEAAAYALSLPVRILRTDDLWYDRAYWSAVMDLKGVGGIISERRGAPFGKVAESFEQRILSAMPPGLMDALGRLDAPSLYRLFEVAEAAWMKSALGVGCKIGPASEQEYDAFIGGFMGIIQLRQPLDFRSTPRQAKPLTPYIGKDGEDRLFIEDTKREIGDKMMRLAQRTQGQPLFYGDFLNPFARLSVLAAESAAAAGSAPVRMLGSQVSDGAGALKVLARAGLGGAARLAPVLAECLWAYLIRPIQLRLEKVAS